MTTTSRKRSPKEPAADWKSKGSPSGLGETEQMAHALVTERPDLMPSVERIMSAELDADGRHRAMELFRDSLNTPGDKRRDPRVAIAECMPKAP